MKPEAFSSAYIDEINEKTRLLLGLEDHEVGYFAFTDTTTNYAYDPMITGIDILFKDGRIIELSKASDLLNLSVLAQPVLKHFLCYPKELSSVKK
jgi:hypothetical protein